MAEKKKRSSTLYLVASIIVLVVIVAVAVVFLFSGNPSGGSPTPPVTLAPQTPGGVSLTGPPCTIAIAGSKIPPSTIELRVMTSTCSAGDVTALRVSINGEVQKETLGISPGQSATFTVTSATNNVIVVAKFANGAENVVYQNPAL